MKTPIKLTRKTVLSILRHEFGCNMVATRDECLTDPAKRYEAQLGNLRITVENDWLSRNGRVCVTVGFDQCCGHLRMYYDPDTFERDYKLEDADREAWKKELMEA